MRRLALAGVLAVLWTGAAVADNHPCARGPSETLTVQRAADRLTLVIGDGRQLKLSGLEPPPPGPHRHAALAALRERTEGHAITWHRPSDTTDRYHRIGGFGVLAEGGSLLQHDLVMQGHARVAATIGDAACARALFQAEREARRARRGLWADPALGPLSAAEPKAIEAALGRFALVEGRVQSVRESGATLYVNFGRRWSEDFTASLPRRSERAFVAAGVPLRSLAGRRVRIRGVVEARGGPWIELTRPEQIEWSDLD